MECHASSSCAERGAPFSTDELLPQVYEELRALARTHLALARGGDTLQPTALVHEAYLRLVRSGDASWANRAHFCGAAVRAIRRVLVERARGRSRLKRGGAMRRADGDVLPDFARELEWSAEILAIDAALERLQRLDARKARVVELRFFGGLDEAETAVVLGVSASTVTREWRFARLWLQRELSG